MSCAPGSHLTTLQAACTRILQWRRAGRPRALRVSSLPRRARHRARKRILHPLAPLVGQRGSRSCPASRAVGALTCDARARARRGQAQRRARGPISRATTRDGFVRARVLICLAAARYRRARSPIPRGAQAVPAAREAPAGAPAVPGRAVPVRRAFHGCPRLAELTPDAGGCSGVCGGAARGAETDFAAGAAALGCVGLPGAR
jgi:hypothetical protein